MRTKKQLLEELDELTERWNEDALKEPDERLPCCDYRELETRMTLLTWVLS